MIPLQKPDFQILKWSNNEGEGEALTLGAPLEKGHHLYRDLQRMYLTQKQDASKDGPTKSGAKAAERKANGTSADAEKDNYLEDREDGYMVDDPEKNSFAEEEDGYMVSTPNDVEEDGYEVDGGGSIEAEDDGNYVVDELEESSRENPAGKEALLSSTTNL